MKNLLEFILIHIVTNPDAIVVEETEQDGEMLYSIRVHADDIGRVIGKSGHVIQSIRTIAKVRAMKEGTRIRIVLVEDAVEPGEAAPEAEVEAEAPANTPVEA